MVLGGEILRPDAVVLGLLALALAGAAYSPREAVRLEWWERIDLDSRGRRREEE